MQAWLTIVFCVTRTLLILPMFEVLTTASGCSIRRARRDTLAFGATKLGLCPATRNNFCGGLNADPLTEECGCKCRDNYATFMEGANSCVANDQVHGGKFQETNLSKRV